MKQIRITFVDEAISCVADLFEDKAPKTARFIWDMLSGPVEGLGVHAMWTGREISFPIAADLIPGDVGFVPPENQTVIPTPGNLIWNAYYPYQWFGNPNPVYDFGIFYGPDSRLFLPMGWRPSNLFGQITENLTDFAKACARVQLEGRKRIRIERLPS
jgi:hypothetical protein